MVAIVQARNRVLCVCVKWKWVVNQLVCVAKVVSAFLRKVVVAYKIPPAGCLRWLGSMPIVNPSSTSFLLMRY